MDSPWVHPAGLDGLPVIVYTPGRIADFHPQRAVVGLEGSMRSTYASIVLEESLSDVDADGGAADQLSLEHRDFLLRCMGKYIHASRFVFLEAANQMVRLYFSPVACRQAAIRVLDGIEGMLRGGRGYEEDVPFPEGRYVSCAREAVKDDSISLKVSLWHAIDDLVEIDALRSAGDGDAGCNPSDLTIAVFREYLSFSPAAQGYRVPEHAGRLHSSKRK